ncbi:MAG TPA: nuclear transport factor 2 family protein [Gammaproteobacteria bacterium]
MHTLTGLVVAVVALGAQAAFADDAVAAREADRAAIEALMWRYVRALDSMDADAYAAVFTEDGRFKSGSTQHQGRAEMKEMIAGLKKTRDERAAAGTPSAPMYHVIANHQITFLGPNEARYDSYWMTVFGAAGENTPVRVAAAGRGVDQLVRVNGQWLIKNRDVAPQ